MIFYISEKTVFTIYYTVQIKNYKIIVKFK